MSLWLKPSKQTSANFLSKYKSVASADLAFFFLYKVSKMAKMGAFYSKPSLILKYFTFLPTLFWPLKMCIRNILGQREKVMTTTLYHSFFRLTFRSNIVQSVKVASSLAPFSPSYQSSKHLYGKRPDWHRRRRSSD